MAYFWVYFHGSIHDSKKYAVTLTASGKTNAKFTYHGNVHTLDKYWEDLVDEQVDTLMVGTKGQVINIFCQSDNNKNSTCIDFQQPLTLKHCIHV